MTGPSTARRRLEGMCGARRAHLRPPSRSSSVASTGPRYGTCSAPQRDATQSPCARPAAAAPQVSTHRAPNSRPAQTAGPLKQPARSNSQHRATASLRHARRARRRGGYADGGAAAADYDYADRSALRRPGLRCVERFCSFSSPSVERFHSFSSPSVERFCNFSSSVSPTRHELISPAGEQHSRRAVEAACSPLCRRASRSSWLSKACTTSTRPNKPSLLSLLGSVMGREGARVRLSRVRLSRVRLSRVRRSSQAGPSSTVAAKQAQATPQPASTTLVAREQAVTVQGNDKRPAA